MAAAPRPRAVRARARADLRHLMRALPALAEVLRYGDVRGTDTELLGRVADGLAAAVHPLIALLMGVDSPREAA